MTLDQEYLHTTLKKKKMTHTNTLFLLEKLDKKFYVIINYKW